MYRKTKTAILIALAAMAVAGCAPLQDLIDGPSAKAEGLALHQHLLEKQYQSWELWPGTRELAPSEFPHGNFQSTRINPRAARALKYGKELPAGALIVKVEFDGRQRFEALSVMLKQKDGQWLFARYEGDRLAEYPDKEGPCLSCHRGQKSNDYLYLSRAR